MLPNETALREIKNEISNCFNCGVESGRLDIIVLMMGYLVRNNNATHAQIFNEVARLEQLIRNNNSNITLDALAG